MSPEPAVRKPRRFPWLIYVIVLVVILLIALAPVISVAIASSIADAHGCRLDEGSVHPCLIDGKDWGPDLYAMSVMGWFMLATIPLGFMALLVWLGILVAHRFYWGRKRKQQA